MAGVICGARVSAIVRWNVYQRRVYNMALKPYMPEAELEIAELKMRCFSLRRISIDGIRNVYIREIAEIRQSARGNTGIVWIST